MKKISILILVATLAVPLLARAEKTLLNLNGSGVAIQGYDPVAFFTDGKPVKGSEKFTAKRDGAIYQFASKEHLKTFLADAAKYEPAYGGYCAYGVSRDKLVEVDVNAFQIVDGRLLLQYSPTVKETFNKDAKANLAKAEANWPKLVDQKGK